MAEGYFNDGVELQERDIALLRGLFECRVMTADHISVLHFQEKREYTKKRLQKLKAAGLVAERTRHVAAPAVHFLTRKAFQLLNQHGHLSDYPPLSVSSFENRANVSGRTITHELEIMDVKAAFHRALSQSPTFSILEFSTWPQLIQFKIPHPVRGGDMLVKPDGFIRIHETEEGANGFVHDCFLELDRSSKDQVRLTNQAAYYLHYYKSGGFAERNGGARSEFKEYQFRVLMVLKTAERRNNTAERLAQNNPPILRQAWLTTFAEVTTDPLGAIWIQPSDYRDTTQGTPFFNDHPNRRFEYHRSSEREAFVESKIRKLRLLETP